MKVLILSASTGNGHMSAAYAIEKALAAAGHDATTVDVLDHTGRGFRGWYRGGYEVLVRKRPKVWGHLYKSSDRKLFNYGFQTLLDEVFVRKMRAYVEREKPDWIVCTHSLPQPALARWRRRSRFKFAVVVTDLYPQLMWLRGKPDWFFVPGEWSREILEKRYPLSRGRTTVAGIPVDPAFGEPVEKSAARSRLGLDLSLPTLLVTSGGIGGGPIGDAVHAIAQAGVSLQAVVLAGRNEQAFLAAERAATEAPESVRILVKRHVATPEMADLAHAADLIVAKPGGITTFESMAARLPFVVYLPFLIPGQEEKNAEFLVEKGIGVQAASPGELRDAVRSLLESPARLKTMSESAGKHANPGSARTIAATLETLAQKDGQKTSAIV